MPALLAAALLSGRRGLVLSLSLSRCSFPCTVYLPIPAAGWQWLFDERVKSRSLVSQYIAALYYSFVLVVGSDNLPAFNNVERVYYLVVLIIGAVLYAFIVSRSLPPAVPCHAVPCSSWLRVCTAAAMPTWAPHPCLAALHCTAHGRHR